MLLKRPFKYLEKQYGSKWPLFFRFVYFIYNISMFPTCMRGTYGGWIPWDWDYRWLWATIWTMGTESWSSLGAVSALNCWASSSASQIPLSHEEITVKIRIYFDNENDLPVGHICRAGWMDSGRHIQRPGFCPLWISICRNRWMDSGRACACLCRGPTISPQHRTKINWKTTRHASHMVPKENFTYLSPDMLQ